MNTHTLNDGHISEHFDLVIDETARHFLGDDPMLYNVIKESFYDLDGVRDFLVDRYGRMPGGRNKVYIDTQDGTLEIGFTHSYWNRDGLHSGGNSWYQTDWIMICAVSGSSVPVIRKDL